MSLPAPITCEALPPDWIAERRAFVARDGFALRGGTGRTGGFTIEVKSLVDNEWRVLELPDLARAFALERDRDSVLRALNGETAARSTGSGPAAGLPAK